MSKVRVQSFAVSLDGYGAGLAQDLEHPLGVGGLGSQGQGPEAGRLAEVARAAMEQGAEPLAPGGVDLRPRGHRAV